MNEPNTRIHIHVRELCFPVILPLSVQRVITLKRHILEKSKSFTLEFVNVEPNRIELIRDFSRDGSSSGVVTGTPAEVAVEANTDPLNPSDLAVIQSSEETVSNTEQQQQSNINSNATANNNNKQPPSLLHPRIKQRI